MDRRCGSLRRFIFPILGLLAIAAGGGVFFQSVYRDTPYYKAMAVGQDWFSLTVVAPAFLITSLLAYRGSLRALFVWLGLVTYLVYTYAIAAFDNQFNGLFLVYVSLLGSSLYGLIVGFLTLNKDEIRTRFMRGTPSRTVSLYLGTLAVLFYAVWLRDVIPALLAGTAPQSVKDIGTPTNAVHVLDMAWILPAFLIAAVSLWRKRSLGYLLAGPLLSFIVVIASAVLSMVLAMSRAGYPIEVPQVVVFCVTLMLGAVFLVWYLASVGRSVHASMHEQTRRLPGDDLIARPIGSFTHAITICSTPHDVWPWLAQMGAGSRAGWYSYDFFDNGRKPSADRIHDELQDLRAGMVFPAMPGVTEGFTLAQFEQEHFLVLDWKTPQGVRTASWTFALEPLDGGSTRLIVRARGGTGYRFLGLPPRIAQHIIRAVHFIMQRKQLLGIAERAESIEEMYRQRIAA